MHQDYKYKTAKLGAKKSNYFSNVSKGVPQKSPSGGDIVIMKSNGKRKGFLEIKKGGVDFSNTY